MSRSSRVGHWPRGAEQQLSARRQRHQQHTTTTHKSKLMKLAGQKGLPLLAPSSLLSLSSPLLPPPCAEAAAAVAAGAVALARQNVCASIVEEQKGT